VAGAGAVVAGADKVGDGGEGGGGGELLAGDPARRRG
jgi:hypothetical protein